ncbi:MAG: Ribosomal protein S12 methylthiotransferase RimO [Promethearchaeota archaeon]|nr:MAG: Ribosomal protein S12 methylthiotransferase RimO [Candidatus Lokiarchaeota archaeon]
MVLLINPRTSKPTELHTSYFREPNNGLLYLAAVLDNNNIDVEILDLEQYIALSANEKKKLLIKVCVDHQIVGLTSLTNTFYDAVELASIIKQAFPNKIIIFGGPHVSFLHESILKTDFSGKNVIDFICIGEAEYSFLKIVKFLKKAHTKASYLEDIRDKVKTIEAIAFINSKGNYEYTGIQKQLIDLRSLPLPARFKLIPINHQYTVANVIINRGCPNECSFCSRQNLFQSIRIRTIDSLEAELRDINSSYTYEFVNFYDNININKTFFEKFCKVLKKREFNLPWGCELRVDNLSNNHILLLKQAGCKVVATGIESASKSVLQQNFKFQNPNKVKKGIEYLKTNDIPVQVYFVLGLPGETVQTFQETLDYIKKLPLTEDDTIDYFMATPYPGSKLWEQQEEFGINIFEYDFSKYDCQHIIFESKILTKEHLEPMRQKAKEIETFFK